jgi:hypothetical protein
MTFHHTPKTNPGAWREAFQAQLVPAETEDEVTLPTPMHKLIAGIVAVILSPFLLCFAIRDRLGGKA